KGQRRARRRLHLGFLAAPPPPIKAGGDQAGASSPVQSHHHVLEHRHALKQLRALEGAAQSQSRDGARLATDNGNPVEAHVTLLPSVDTKNDVEQRRLSGPVGTDESTNLASPYLHPHAIENLEATEGEVQILERKDDRAHCSRPPAGTSSGRA